MKLLTALVLTLVVCSMVLFGGCKKAGQTAGDAASAPEQIKAKMQAGGCSKMTVPAGKTGKGSPSTEAPAKGQ